MKLNWMILLAAVALVACNEAAEPGDTPKTTSEQTKTTDSETPDTTVAAEEQAKTDGGTATTQADGLKNAAPGATAPKTGEEVAVIETNLGRIVLKFFPDKAPNHVANFKKLAKEKFYDGTKFHRVIPGFMIQGGDPNSKDNDRSNDGMGGPKENVKAEFNDRPHTRGILSMARSSDPDSAGSQFFITVADTPQLDGQYTVFGQVVEGMDVADKIVALPRDENDNPNANNPAIMKSVKIVKWPVK